MYFSIPDTEELNDGHGSTYVGYNIHINGAHHCTVRYKQLHNLHEQLKREHGVERLPIFPPKKYLPLTASQLEERRLLLEKYIQIIGQDTSLASSELLMGFLLSAQQETTKEMKEEVKLDVYTMTNHQIALKVFTTDRTQQVLAKACSSINLSPEYVGYFALFLVRKNDAADGGDLVMVRKLQDFESPYISHKCISQSNRIVIRKSYWFNDYDLELMNNPVALNLLYSQTVSDIERGWILCTRDTKSQLAHLQARLAKHEYIELARSLRYYGYIQFQSCYCDYPVAQTKVLVAIGGQELSLRLVSGSIVKEGCFKVTRMRCWRITVTHNKLNIPSNSSNSNYELELSFEYLMSKDNLKWISISSDQAILMSIFLQSMVDELLLVKNGGLTQPQRGVTNDVGRTNTTSWSYMRRDGSSQVIDREPGTITTPTVDSGPTECQNNSTSTAATPNKFQESFSIKRLQEKFSSVSFKSAKEFVENHAFEGIGDDDL